MPIINSSYKPPLLFKNGHFSTIYSGIIRNVKGLKQERTRLELSDGDFIDLDWSFANTKSNKLVVLLHGLEGNAQSTYILGSAKIFNQYSYDVVAVNFRSCSGEQNRFYRSYHSGETGDLQELINFITETTNYVKLYIKGYSLGGNVTLKYFGENKNIHPKVKAGMAVAAPCDLYGSSIELHKLKNKPYAIMFKYHLLKKLKAKQKLFPEKISEKEIESIKSLKDFDNVYTSKAHGFIDAIDYYQRGSSLQLINQIEIPTLILNAKNDSFLSHSCFPINEANNNNNVYLEITSYGGHVGFYMKGESYYDEIRGVEFFQKF